MNIQTTKQGQLKKLYKPRKKDAKKGDFGYILIVGGSECYSGAPALSAMAAYGAGSDLVTICAPKRAADIAAGFSPSIITCPLKGEKLSPEHENIILDTSHKYDVLLLGPGAGKNTKTSKLFKTLLLKTDLPTVIDADALQAVDKNNLVNKKTILTPHLGEFKKLTGENLKKLKIEEKARKVKKAAKNLNTVILLKGPEDIISDGKNTAINKTGSAYMSVGGTGDILAGICAGMLARRTPPFWAAQAGAYLSGKAGEKAGKESLTLKKILKAIGVILENL